MDNIILHWEVLIFPLMLEHFSTDDIDNTYREFRIPKLQQCTHCIITLLGYTNLLTISL